MMSDIYTQARCVLSFINLTPSLIYYYIFSAGEEATAVPIAVIDLEELEEYSVGQQKSTKKLKDVI